jgi:hypothetical protein
VSTILRALQRVEGEKSGEREMAGLREGLVPDAPPPVPARRGRVRLGIGALLALLLLGFLLWWLIPAEEAFPPAAVSAPPATAEPELAPETGEAPAIALEAESAPAEAAPPLAEEPPAPPESWSAESLPPFQPPEVTPPLEELTQAPEPEEAPPQFVELEEEPSSALVETPLPRVPAPARVATLRPPEVMVKKTFWHPMPERRVAEVEVEGRKGVLELHEGDAVGTLVISEIQPSGVVFLHGGVRLHRKVGAAQ